MVPLGREDIRALLEDLDRKPYFSGSALRVDVASARFLLAMKLFASRVETALDDIELLYREVGFTTVEEGLDLVATAYGSRAVAPKVQ